MGTKTFRGDVKVYCSALSYSKKVDYLIIYWFSFLSRSFGIYFFIEQGYFMNI